MEEGGRAWQRERGCCLLVVFDGSCRWRRSEAGKGCYGGRGRLALPVGRGGEGGRRRAYDGQELKASDAGWTTREESGRLIRRFGSEAGNSKNMSRVDRDVRLLGRSGPVTSRDWRDGLILSIPYSFCSFEFKVLPRTHSFHSKL
jgi:hypothetical protein